MISGTHGSYVEWSNGVLAEKPVFENSYDYSGFPLGKQIILGILLLDDLYHPTAVTSLSGFRKVLFGGTNLEFCRMVGRISR